MHKLNINLCKNKVISPEVKLLKRRLSDFESFEVLAKLYPLKAVYLEFDDNKAYEINKSNFDYYRNHFAKQEYKIIFKKPPRREFNPSGGGWDSVMRW